MTAQDKVLAEFELRYLGASQLVQGVVTIHALSIDMPRMFPPDKLFRIATRQYNLPLRQRAQKADLDWLLERMFADEREFVLKQPFAARKAEKAGDKILL